MAAIEELMALTGASKIEAAQAYMACGKDKNAAANFLFTDMPSNQGGGYIDEPIPQHLLNPQPSNPPQSQPN